MSSSPSIYPSMPCQSRFRLQLRLAVAAVVALSGLAASERGTAYAQSQAEAVVASPSATAVAQINEARLRAHLQFLASDLLEGRGPGTRGDELGQAYIVAQLRQLGFQAAGTSPDGWRQPVPLRGVTTTSPATVTFKHRDQQLTLKNVDDYILNNGSALPTVKADEVELVFVGYGITAPEYQWDDYQGIDVKDKIVVVMNNDPESSPELFAGKKRLYYGRWDYKYINAALHGAAGALIIHTTPSAGYPYQVVQTSWSGEQFELAKDDEPALPIRGWITDEAATKLFSTAGHDLNALRQAAQQRGFQGTPLGITTSIELAGSIRERVSQNVLATLPGSDPQLQDEVVIVMAHHDHLGLAEQRDENGDNIYNGAIDNASGTAGMLCLAAAFANLPQPPKRTILFAAVAAEEQGLLGSKYFAANPTIAPGKMAAVVNIDGVNFMGRTRDVNLIGDGKSTLDEVVKAAAAAQGRIVVPDQFPDRGSYYRSDQFSLARIGVPGVYLNSGIHVIDKPDGWGKEQLEQWVQKTYHQPSDEYSESMTLDGAVEDLQLLFEIAYQIASSAEMPQWMPGDEFEAARLAALKAVQ